MRHEIYWRQRGLLYLKDSILKTILMSIFSMLVTCNMFIETPYNVDERFEMLATLSCVRELVTDLRHHFIYLVSSPDQLVSSIRHQR